MPRRCVFGSLFVHLESSIAFVFRQMVVGTLLSLATRGIRIYRQQECRRPAEDLVVFHAQIGLFEIHAQSEGFDTVATAFAGDILCPLKEDGGQSPFDFFAV